jgi:predicted ATPase
LRQHGLLRPLSASELSDGTLRFLLWTAALLTPRPPELMVLNEPETSLHPDFLPALARLIAFASGRAHRSLSFRTLSCLSGRFRQQKDANTRISRSRSGKPLLPVR